MASHIKTQLTQISTSAGGTHRDLAEKYKVVLEAILKLGEQDNLLRSIVNFSISCLSLLDGLGQQTENIFLRFRTFT